MNLTLYDTNNEFPIQEINFPAQIRGGTSPSELEFHLWNRKGKEVNYIAKDIKVFVEGGNTNYEGKEIIDNNWVEIKSDGVIGSGIDDDAFPDFVPITSEGVSLGDIPTNTARKLFFRLKTSSSSLTTKALFKLKICYNYNRLKTYQVSTISVNYFFLNKFGGFFL